MKRMKKQTVELTFAKKQIVELTFCQLDARDHYLTGYHPCAFYDVEKDKPAKLTQELETLQILANREYLTRLATLQNELSAKYSKEANKLTTETPPVIDPWGVALDETDWETAKKLASELFPGEEADYYT